MPSFERGYSPLQLHSNQQNEDAPLMQEHPLWISVLLHMRLLHTHISRDAYVVSRDNRLYNASVASGA